MFANNVMPSFNLCSKFKLILEVLMRYYHAFGLWGELWNISIHIWKFLIYTMPTSLQPPNWGFLGAFLIPLSFPNMYDYFFDNCQKNDYPIFLVFGLPNLMQFEPIRLICELSFDFKNKLSWFRSCQSWTKRRHVHKQSRNVEHLYLMFVIALIRT